MMIARKTPIIPFLFLNPKAKSERCIRVKIEYENIKNISPPDLLYELKSNIKNIAMFIEK